MAGEHPQVQSKLNVGENKFWYRVHLEWKRSQGVVLCVSDKKKCALQVYKKFQQKYGYAEQ